MKRYPSHTRRGNAAQAQYGGLPGAPKLNAPGANGLCCKYDDQQRQDTYGGYQPYTTTAPNITTSHPYDAPMMPPPTFDPYGSPQ